MSSIRQRANIKGILLKCKMIVHSNIKLTIKVFKMPLQDDNSSAMNLPNSRVVTFCKLF